MACFNYEATSNHDYRVHGCTDAPSYGAGATSIVFHMTLDAGNDQQNWQMDLQYWTGSTWSNVGAYTGYLTYSSPSTRSFSLSGKKAGSYRIRVTLRNEANTLISVNQTSAFIVKR